MWVRSLGQEDPLEREMATHSRILASEIPQQWNWAGYSPWDHERVRHGLATKQQQFKKKVTFHTVLYGSLCVFWEMSLYNLTIINEHLLISYQVQGNMLVPGGKMKYKTNSKHLFNQED